MDSIEPECEADFITDIWYDYSKDPDSYDYDSDYESPEEIKAKKEAEKIARRQAWWERFFERRRAKEVEYEKKQILKQMKKELRDAKKANDNMDIDINIQEQIAEDLAKLSLNHTNDYNNHEITPTPTPTPLHNMVSQMERIKAKLPPAVQQLDSIQQADKEIKDMVVTRKHKILVKVKH